MQKFYENKTIFITGGSGFLGKVLIEKLLRSTKVQRIYMLLRPKNSAQGIEQRLAAIFEESLFEQLLKQQPDAAQRVVAVYGDVAQPKLGLSPIAENMLIEQVDVVVHGAATVRFTDPLYDALNINVCGTKRILQLAKQMKRLKAFVHISTAYAHCVIPHIEEKFYAPHSNSHLSVDKILQIAEILGPELLKHLTPRLVQDYPNNYTYTKALAEEMVAMQGHELPIGVIRPGIVLATSREPVRGWTDNLYGPIGTLLGVARGILRVVYGRLDDTVPLVPADFCANAIAATAWHVARSAATPTCLAPETPLIYNFVPYEQNAITWRMCQEQIAYHGVKMPLLNMMWYPIFLPVSNKFVEKLMRLFYHTVPGLMFDVLMIAQGRKPWITKLYVKIHKNIGQLDYFKTHVWTFGTTNITRLWQALTPMDQQCFNFNMATLDWSEYIEHSLIGMRWYLAKEAPENVARARKRLKRLRWLNRLFKLLIYGGLLGLLWLLFSAQTF